MAITGVSILSFLDLVSGIAQNSTALQIIALVISTPPILLGSLQFISDVYKGIKGLCRRCCGYQMSPEDRSRQRTLLTNEILSNKQKNKKMKNQLAELYIADEDEEDIAEMQNDATPMLAKT